MLSPVADEREGRLLDLCLPAETLYISDVDHGFVGKTPQITRANDQALARTRKFIDALFGR